MRRVKREADSPAKVSFLRFECFSSEQQRATVCDAVAKSFSFSGGCKVLNERNVSIEPVRHEGQITL